MLGFDLHRLLELYWDIFTKSQVILKFPSNTLKDSSKPSTPLGPTNVVKFTLVGSIKLEIMLHKFVGRIVTCETIDFAFKWDGTNLSPSIKWGWLFSGNTPRNFGKSILKSKFWLWPKALRSLLIFLSLKMERARDHLHQRLRKYFRHRPWNGRSHVCQFQRRQQFWMPGNIKCLSILHADGDTIIRQNRGNRVHKLQKGRYPIHRFWSYEFRGNLFLVRRR